jgi:poly-gamma-glutamate synthesis protein (capsule biosynthesis protein)
VTLLFTGDMLVSDEMRARALRYGGRGRYDFRPMLTDVAPIIRAADWAVCHQETPISADNRGLSGYPRFNVPAELAEAEHDAGYDACSTASNHTVDEGAPGIRATLDTLDRWGIRHSGSARTEAEAAHWSIYEVGGIRIGHLTYTFGLNGLTAPASWAVDLIDPARIIADAAAIRGAGAEFVVVGLHFGEEQVHEPSDYQEEVVKRIMTSRDVDLVVGHHAHVVQPVERLPDGRWVIFGLGNFLAQMSAAANSSPPHRDGVIVTVRVAPAGGNRFVVDRVGYVPTFVHAPEDVVRLAPQFSRQRTAAYLTARGAPVVDDTPR